MERFNQQKAPIIKCHSEVKQQTRHPGLHLADPQATASATLNA